MRRGKRDALPSARRWRIGTAASLFSFAVNKLPWCDQNSLLSSPLCQTRLCFALINRCIYLCGKFHWSRVEAKRNESVCVLMLHFHLYTFSSLVWRESATAAVASTSTSREPGSMRVSMMKLYWVSEEGQKHSNEKNNTRCWVHTRLPLSSYSILPRITLAELDFF